VFWKCGLEARTTRDYVQAGEPTPREITCGLGSPHHERLRAGREAHTTKENVQAEEPTQRKRTCGLEARTTRDYVRYRRANKKSPLFRGLRMGEEGLEPPTSTL
jgi:hypothetical protein